MDKKVFIKIKEKVLNLLITYYSFSAGQCQETALRVCSPGPGCQQDEGRPAGAGQTTRYTGGGEG